MISGFWFYSSTWWHQNCQVLSRTNDDAILFPILERNDNQVFNYTFQMKQAYCSLIFSFNSFSICKDVLWACCYSYIVYWMWWQSLGFLNILSKHILLVCIYLLCIFIFRHFLSCFNVCLRHMKPMIICIGWNYLNAWSAEHNNQQLKFGHCLGLDKLDGTVMKW